MICLATFSGINKFPDKFKARAKEIYEILENKENSFCQLDFLITKNETIKCLHNLKNGKSTGLDCITNEMLKIAKLCY